MHLELKVKFTLNTATEAQRKVEVQLYSFFTPAQNGVVVNETPRPLYPMETDPVRIVQKVGWAPGPVWNGAEYLAPNRDSIPGPSGL
jgi:hypothetical protein